MIPRQMIIVKCYGDFLARPSPILLNGKENYLTPAWVIDPRPLQNAGKGVLFSESGGKVAWRD